jgi:folate-binding protein YgfZ
MQGQFSNDINAVTSSAGQLTSYSTPKGRMLATLYICMRDDTYYLVISKDIAEAVMKRLQMYVMRSKVTIKQSENSLLLGICNDESATVLNFLKLEAPEKDYQVSFNDSLLCMNIPSVNTRYLIIGNETLSEHVNQLDSGVINVYSNSYWQWQDIMAGVPNITSATQEAFVPQMANMELIDGVSFSKGCYPGQEIVARLHYIGNANRRMFRIETDADSEINIGDEIYSEGSEQPVGKFLSVIKQSENSYTGLAVLRVEAANKGQLVTVSPSGKNLYVKPLPYEVPTDIKEK